MPFAFMFMPVIFLALPIGALGFFGWLGLRYVRARERDVGARVESVSADELARLQDTVVELQSAVHALTERQEFVERLLERPRSDTAASKKVTTPAATDQS